MNRLTYDPWRVLFFPSCSSLRQLWWENEPVADALGITRALITQARLIVDTERLVIRFNPKRLPSSEPVYVKWCIMRNTTLPRVLVGLVQSFIPLTTPESSGLLNCHECGKFCGEPSRCNECDDLCYFTSCVSHIFKDECDICRGDLMQACGDCVHCINCSGDYVTCDRCLCENISFPIDCAICKGLFCPDCVGGKTDDYAKVCKTCISQGKYVCAAPSTCEFSHVPQRCPRCWRQRVTCLDDISCACTGPQQERKEKLGKWIGIPLQQWLDAMSRQNTNHVIKMVESFCDDYLSGQIHDQHWVSQRVNWIRMVWG
jgi:hypothetical protein